MLADRVRMGSGGGLNVPGPKTLLYGDMEAGLFGEISASELITGDNLANMVGISEGVSLYNDDPWLKFAYRGNVQFISKKPLRHSISFNHIESANCVEGGKTITIKGVPYIVELIEGYSTENSVSGDRGSTDTEWNKLMIGIFSGLITYPQYAVGVKRWHVYNLSDLGLGYRDSYGDWRGNRNGIHAWCKGAVSTYSYRGSGSCTSLANFISSTPSRIYEYGWRPVLRLV